MANNERDLRELSDRQLDSLSQDVIVEQIRRVEEDPNAFVVPSESSVEEDWKCDSLSAESRYTVRT